MIVVNFKFNDFLGFSTIFNNKMKFSSKRNVVTVMTIIALIFLCFFVICDSATVAEKDLTYSKTEKLALMKLKERMLPLLPAGYMQTDFYLIRWLRAKNLNVAQAETFLIQHLQWRQQNGIDNLQNQSWSDMEADFPVEMDTHDLQGQPIGTIDIYIWDIRRTVLQGRTPRLLSYLFRLLEDINTQIFDAQSNGKNVTRFVVLGNADGFNLVQHACSLCLPIWVQFVQAFQDHYPGFLDEVIVVESPATVNVVLDLIRPLLSPETQKALKIFGHNRDKWMSYLDGKISREQRRIAYGGTKRD